MVVKTVVLWEGPSLLNSDPIVVIATGLNSMSRNTKTGNMVQTWIIRQDCTPTEAVRTGLDVAICGHCRHRGTSCYVQTHFAVQNVWRAYAKGDYGVCAPYEKLSLVGAGHDIRVGSYGDPAAVPIVVWMHLLKQARTFTGYTHQWRTCDPGFRNFCMASVDSEIERDMARAQGWRTFRVRTARDALDEREVVCPASAEAGKLTTCGRCRACGGLSSKARVDIAIVAHGAKRNVNAFERGPI